MSRLREKLGQITLSMWAALFASIAVAGYILWWSLHPDAPILPMLAVIGAMVGWLVAMLATPYSKEERKQFSEFGKVISGIITGFVLSKIGPVIDALVAVPETGGRPPILDRDVWPQLVVTFASFLLAALFVFGGRQYWASDDEDPLRDWIQKRPGRKLTRKEAIKLLVERDGPSQKIPGSS